MPKLELGGSLYEVDKYGFLQEPERWSEEVARAYAKLEGVEELTEEHWRVINYLREYYAKNGICPMVKKMLKETGLTLKRVWELFPQGPAQSACKWAGIPRPTGCV